MANLFTKFMNLIAGPQPQGWLFDTTTYCGKDGLSPSLIKQNGFAGMLIQTGRGDFISPLLQEHIDVAEECDIPWAGWHIPDPRDGSMQFQAELIVAQPRVRGHLLIGDLEPIEAGNWATMVTSSQAHEFLCDLADVSGRPSWGYANPDVLLNHYKMPEWVYLFDWWIAQYPSSSWKKFEEFLAYYKWRYPSYFASNERFKKRIKMWQWTQWGDARYYYASESGVRSGDLDIAMMTVPEIQQVLAPIEQPIPDPVDMTEWMQKIEGAVDGILATITDYDELHDGILATITDLVETDDEIHDKIVEFEQRIENLEDGKPDGDEVLHVKVVSDANCSIYSPTTYDKACDGQTPPGKPLFETKVGVFGKDTEFEIFPTFKFSCKDDPNDPWVIQSGGAEFGVVASGPYKGYFVPRKRFFILA